MICGLSSPPAPGSVTFRSPGCFRELRAALQAQPGDSLFPEGEGGGPRPLTKILPQGTGGCGAEELVLYKQ